ncbi:hypothetical protein SprV_0502014800 [Sparganum proliferum]
MASSALFRRRFRLRSKRSTFEQHFVSTAACGKVYGLSFAKRSARAEMLYYCCPEDWDLNQMGCVPTPTSPLCCVFSLGVPLHLRTGFHSLCTSMAPITRNTSDASRRTL